jgi:hypothetical protein
VSTRRIAYIGLGIIIIGTSLLWVIRPKHKLPTDVYYNHQSHAYQEKNGSLFYDPIARQYGPYSLPYAQQQAAQYRK